MKKLLILIMCAFLFVPSIIFADMGAPIIKEYEARVIAKNGAPLYNNTEDAKLTGDSLSYGLIVKVDFEENGLASVGEYGYVKISDLEPVEKEVKFNSKDYSKKVSAIVLSKVEYKKGPAGAYETIGELNPGDVITLYIDEETRYEYPWGYVEGKGFVNTYGGKIAYEPRTLNLIAVYDTKIGNATLKSGTKFTAKVYYLDPWSWSYYIIYDGNKGIVSTDDVTSTMFPLSA